MQIGCYLLCALMSIRIYNKKLATEVAADLLSVGAIKLSPEEPFTWASGWKSPIYCDNRLSLSFPAVRSKIKTALSLAISNSFGGVNAIAGVAIAGIPQGALVADSLDLPFIYIRSSPKGHGLQNMIEGKLEKGQKVVLVEDLVSTGSTSLAAAGVLREAGAEIVGMAAIFTYGFPASEKNFGKKNVELIALSDYNHLLNHVQDEMLFKNDLLKTLKEWRTDPSGWGQ